MSTLKYWDEDAKRYTSVPLGYGSVAIGNFAYKTYEQCIGEWVDGRPLYRKVYKLKSFSEDTEFGRLVDLSELLIKDCIECKVIANITSDIQYNSANWLYVWFDDANNCLAINQAGEVYQDIDLIVITEYTKYTDVAGSFNLEMISVGDLQSEATDEEVMEVLS